MECVDIPRDRVFIGVVDINYTANVLVGRHLRVITSGACA